MTPDRWQRAKEIVADALEKNAAERPAFVAGACAEDSDLEREVNSMLAHADDETRFDPALEELQRVRAASDDPRTGQIVGAYRITREIGRGGMGAVYLGERADAQFEKKVALKILKRGTDTEEVLRRFQTERQILARLEHPNIAQLIDGGTTEDGLPYFAMQFVAGVPITTYCDSLQLDIPARIALFLKVCGAVEFAHRNLVVHRDLKPGNILVTAGGEPQLLDFGIAKLLAADEHTIEMTAPDRQRFTPGYASPEQVRNEPVTTASDVYSLGALLYELLTRRTPHLFPTAHPSPTELFRVIVESEPTRASQAATEPEKQRALRGDLDNILLAALRKEPERRYSGVAAFSEDLRRYLAGRPVSARKDSAGYRTSKFIRRHKAGVAAAVILLLTLLGGIATTAWQARIAQLERARAEERFNQVRKLAHSVLFDYHDAIASLAGSTAVRETLVRDALDYLDNLSRDTFADHTLMRELATAYQKVGRIQGNSYYSNLGDPTAAMKSYRESLRLREKLLAVRPDDPDLLFELADSHQGMGDIHYTLGDLRAGLASYESALQLRQPLAAQNPGEVRFALPLAQLYTRFGDIYGLEGYANLGDTGAAFAYYRKAHEILAPLAAAHPDDQSLQTEYGNAVSTSAMLARSAGRAEEALQTAERGLELLRKVARPDDQDSIALLLKAKSVLRYALVENNRIEEAIALSREVIAELEKMIVADPKNNQFPRNLGVTRNALGNDLLTAGKIAEAQEQHRAAIRIVEEALTAAPDSEDSKSDVAFTWQRLGQAQMANGEHQAAVEIFRRALALREPSLAADSANTRLQEDVSSIYADLGTALAGVGDFAAAKDAFRKAIPAAEELSTQDPTHARRKARLAEVYFDAGKVYQLSARSTGTVAQEDLRQAREHFTRSLALWQELRERNTLAPAYANKAEAAAAEIASYPTIE